MQKTRIVKIYLIFSLFLLLLFTYRTSNKHQNAMSKLHNILFLYSFLQHCKFEDKSRKLQYIQYNHSGKLQKFVLRVMWTSQYLIVMLGISIEHGHWNNNLYKAGR